MSLPLFDLPPPHPPMLEGDQRFTLPETLAWCMEKASVAGWDLDVAACEEAHCAPRFYAHADNGLALPWEGHVWCNPPYSTIRPWVEKAWSELQAGRCSVIGMLVPGNRTEQPWWQELVEGERDGRRDASQRGTLTSYFLPGRTKFGRPGDPLGEHAGSPPFTCVLLVWRT